MPDGLDAVEVGHDPVDDVDAEGLADAEGFFGADGGFAPGDAPFALEAGGAEHVGDALAGVDVVVDDEGAQAVEFGDGGKGGLGVGDLEGEGDGEFGALAFPGLEGDGAAHHFDDVLGDGHAEAGALDAGDGGVFFAGEGVEDDLGEFGGHADAVVLAAEFVGGAAVLGGGGLGDAQGDGAAGGGVFDGVGEEVEEDLVEVHLVAVDEFVADADGVDAEGVLAGLDVGLDDVVEGVEDVGEGFDVFVEGHLAGLDAAHVEDVVDEGEEVFGGLGDGLEVFLDVLGFGEVGGGEAGEADDGVHGGGRRGCSSPA